MVPQASSQHTADEQGALAWLVDSAGASLGRLLRICALSAVFVVAFVVAWGARSARRPRLLRRYLQQCGGGMVKLGQMLAMRYDLLPLEYCNELGTLLDDMPPFDAQVVRRIVEKEFGCPMEGRFLEFDPVPLGSASVAQVHRARLLTGEQVVIKVLRPGIERLLSTDLRLMRWLAALADATTLLKGLSVREMVSEFDRLTREELDLRIEARSANHLHRLLQTDEIDHRAPRVYLEHSGRRVLTLELFEGVWVRELVAAVQAGDRQKLDAWARLGITPQRTARLLFRSFLEQAYRHQVFHADPHAGNLILLEGGTLGYVDFGMVGWLEEKTWSQQYRLFEAISREDVQGAYAAMSDTLVLLPGCDEERFETEFKHLLRQWLLAAGSREAGVATKSSGRFLFNATLAIRRAGLGLPMDTLRLHRAALISDMIQLSLFPEMDANHEMAQFFREELERRIKETLEDLANPRHAIPALWRMGSLASAAVPGLLGWLSRELPQFTRSGRRPLSALEEMLGLLLRYARRVTFLSIPAIALLWTAGPPQWGGGARPLAALKEFSDSIDGPWVLVWTSAALLVAFALGKAAERLSRNR